MSSVELRYGLAVKFRQGLLWVGKAVEVRRVALRSVLAVKFGQGPLRCG